ncbi:siderophore ABC transporter substrate-binding protein [Lentibacillus cibarius]|uniref:Siderophore ABC transporter substrate-binding protein n=1 Tax=Lentibacillus cibarius TaxID=2583219 RepID=A0A549YHE6_9BACI|nr:siderophore ABC transporter substrate-binding protein [Lentibacillus cibarius]
MIHKTSRAYGINNAGSYANIKNYFEVIKVFKKISVFLLVILLTVALAACGSSDSDNSSSNSNDSSDKDNKESAKETITVDHELDSTDVPKNPENVVVFDYGALETLDKLDVPVKGVAKGSALPEYLSKYEGSEYKNVGSLIEPDFEAINELQPELIIISSRQSDAYKELSKIAPTIYVGIDNKNYMDSFTKNTKTLGKIFEKEDEANQALDDIKQSIQDLQDKTSDNDKKGLIVLSTGGKISAYGPGSRFGLVHDVFGVQPADENIEASTHGQKVTFEYVAEQDPDYLFVIDRDKAIGGDTVASEVLDNELVNGTKAAENDNIIYLNPNVWYLSGGGLLSMEEMIKEVDNGLE